jgi:hypothetical protein
MILNLCGVIEDITSSAVWAVGFPRMANRQVNHGMSQGTTAAVAPDGRRLNVNDFGWLHVGRSYISKESLGLFYRIPSAARLD